jgi:hypothetical protein
MSDVHPDPITEVFRHGSTNAQTAITGVARIMEQRLVRQERERRFEAEQQRQVAEQARAEAATIRAAQAARERQMQETQQQQDLAANSAGGEISDPVHVADPASPGAESTVDQAIADAYPAGPAAAAARAASARSTASAAHGQGENRPLATLVASVTEMG